MSLLSYTLHLADNALILGHRNSEWCGHGPVLEQDIAISNISLDLIGQARNFYQYAATLAADGSTEDSFAYFRDAYGFKNILLAEQPKGDWAFTVLRQFLFSAYQHTLFGSLKHGRDEQLAAIAVKSLKEISYHLRWSSEWVIRLGDGTDESHNRIEHAVNDTWVFTDEMFAPAEYETEMTRNNIIGDIATMKPEWEQMVKAVFEEATLIIPNTSNAKTGGKNGKHSSHLEQLLDEMQSVARTDPGAEW